MPMGPSGKSPSATLGGWNLGINVNISKEKKDAAVKFVKFLTSDEAQIFQAVNGGRIPVRKDLFKKNADVLKANPHFESLYDVFINAKPRPVSPIYPQISDVMQIQVHKAITGAQPVDQSLKKICKKRHHRPAGQIQKKVALIKWGRPFAGAASFLRSRYQCRIRLELFTIDLAMKA